MTHTDAQDPYTLHAHVSTASRDCDGPFYRDYVIPLTEEEISESKAKDGINDFIDIEFRERVLLSQMSVYSCMQGKLEVEETGFRWHESTEEGYRASEVEWCWDSGCDPKAYMQRDVYAEQMGY